MSLVRRLALGAVAVAGVTVLGLVGSAWFALGAPVATDTTPPADVARLTCGQTTLVVRTYCSGEGLERTCAHQESTATTVGNESAPAHDILKPKGTAAVSAQCYVSKKKEPYFVLTYANGGNCELCEWVDILDMRLHPLVRDAQHHKTAVNKLHRRLSAVGKEISLTR